MPMLSPEYKLVLKTLSAVEPQFKRIFEDREKRLINTRPEFLKFARDFDIAMYSGMTSHQGAPWIITGHARYFKTVLGKNMSRSIDMMKAYVEMVVKQGEFIARNDHSQWYTKKDAEEHILPSLLMTTEFIIGALMHYVIPYVRVRKQALDEAVIETINEWVDDLLVRIKHIFSAMTTIIYREGASRIVSKLRKKLWLASGSPLNYMVYMDKRTMYITTRIRTLKRAIEL